MCETVTLALAGKAQVLRWCTVSEKTEVFPEEDKQKFNSFLWQES